RTYSSYLPWVMMESLLAHACWRLWSRESANETSRFFRIERYHILVINIREVPRKTAWPNQTWLSQIDLRTGRKPSQHCCLKGKLERSITDRWNGDQGRWEIEAYLQIRAIRICESGSTVW